MPSGAAGVPPPTDRGRRRSARPRSRAGRAPVHRCAGACRSSSSSRRLSWSPLQRSLSSPERKWWSSSRAAGPTRQRDEGRSLARCTRERRGDDEAASEIDRRDDRRRLLGEDDRIRLVLRVPRRVVQRHGGGERLSLPVRHVHGHCAVDRERLRPLGCRRPVDHGLQHRRDLHAVGDEAGVDTDLQRVGRDRNPDLGVGQGDRVTLVRLRECVGRERDRDDEVTRRGDGRVEHRVTVVLVRRRTGDLLLHQRHCCRRRRCDRGRRRCDRGRRRGGCRRR